MGHPRATVSRTLPAEKSLQTQIDELNNHLSQRITKQGLRIRDNNSLVDDLPEKVRMIEDAVEYWITKHTLRFVALERPWYVRLWALIRGK